MTSPTTSAAKSGAALPHQLRAASTLTFEAFRTATTLSSSVFSCAVTAPLPLNVAPTWIAVYEPRRALPSMSTFAVLVPTMRIAPRFASSASASVKVLSLMRISPDTSDRLIPCFPVFEMALPLTTAPETVLSCTPVCPVFEIWFPEIVTSRTVERMMPELLPRTPGSMRLSRMSQPVADVSPS